MFLLLFPILESIFDLILDVISATKISWIRRLLKFGLWVLNNLILILVNIEIAVLFAIIFLISLKFLIWLLFDIKSMNVDYLSFCRILSSY